MLKKFIAKFTKPAYFLPQAEIVAKPMSQAEIDSLVKPMSQAAIDSILKTVR